MFTRIRFASARRAAMCVGLLCLPLATHAYDVSFNHWTIVAGPPLGDGLASAVVRQTHRRTGETVEAWCSGSDRGVRVYTPRPVDALPNWRAPRRSVDGANARLVRARLDDQEWTYWAVVIRSDGRGFDLVAGRRVVAVLGRVRGRYVRWNYRLTGGAEAAFSIDMVGFAMAFRRAAAYCEGRSRRAEVF